MEAGDFQWAWTILEVTIHERDGDEEGLIIAVEVGEHLDDPVHHTSADWRCDLVPLETICCIKLELLRPEVLLYVAAKFGPQIQVLSLDVSRGSARHVPRWMALHYFVLSISHLLDTWVDGGGLDRNLASHRWRNLTAGLDACGGLPLGTEVASYTPVEKSVIEMCRLGRLLGLNAWAARARNHK